MFRWRSVDLVVAAALTVSDSVQSAVSASTLTPGRSFALVAGVLALIGLIVGARALARSAGRIGRSDGRRGAILALVLASIGGVAGGLVVSTADGGLGTGNGLGGGIVAMTLGAIGMALGAWAVARTRRTG